MSDYGHPHIPFSKLKELRNKAKESKEYWDDYNTWLYMVRAEIDRLVIEDLATQLRNARNYRSIEGYPCPLCEYKDGVFVKNCSMHQQIENLTNWLDRAEAIIKMYEEENE